MKGTLPGPGGILTIHRAFTQKPTTEAFLSYYYHRYPQGATIGCTIAQQ
jgi:hypothetical protein